MTCSYSAPGRKDLNLIYKTKVQLEMQKKYPYLEIRVILKTIVLNTPLNRKYFNKITLISQQELYIINCLTFIE